ncbi:hypothetical protein [Streptomyces sp. H34-S4]|uniref:hypothetical protein n=1 Tax=Streptomyces sp. H34-S4 TaxID=2996463 RepID=UPI00226ED43B|nr:hypothetical protein [Streptomyces sp. H34-S4]MCY0934963.1 hypothetical protein [Streptomyces sp. H34-S4]
MNRDAQTLRARFGAWEADTLAEGVEYVTTRRIAEELGLTAGETRTLLGTLRAQTPVRQAPPLWRLAGTPAAARIG